MGYLLLGGLLLTLSSALVTATLRLDSRAAFVVGIWLVAYAQVVLVAFALSPVDALGRAGWLAGQALSLLLAALAWTLAGRPSPPGSWRPGLRATAARARAHFAVALMVAAAGLAVLLQLAVGLGAAPSNYDSLTYHLSRAAYWLQEGGVGYFDGGSVRQLASAPNAEIAMAWTMAVSGKETFVELVQWSALVASALAVYLVALEVGARREHAAFAAAVWCVLPNPLIEATTTQNDLVVSACLAATVAFGLRGLRRRSSAELAMAGVAWGLAMGSKGSAAFALPGLVLVLVAAVVELKPARRHVVTLLAAVALGSLALGSFSYIANQAEKGGPFGDLPDIGKRQTRVDTNLARVSLSFLESPGMPIGVADHVLGQTFRRWFPEVQTRHIPWQVMTETDEDRTTAGLVGWLVLGPLVLALLVLPRRRPLVRALAAASVLFVVFFAVSHEATPFNGRILMLATVIAAPLLAYTARSPWSRAGVVLLAFASMLPALLMNPAKPVIPELGEPWVWSTVREQQMVAHADRQQYLYDLYSFRPGSRIGVLAGENAWDYPIFGRRRERWVRRFNSAPTGPARCEWLNDVVARYDLDGFVFAEAGTPPPPFDRVPSNHDYYVIHAANVPVCRLARAP